MGVDLTAVPAIRVNTAFTIVPETGPDLSAFPSAQHFCSWLELAPGTRIGGARHRARPARRGAPVAITATVRELV